MAINTLKIWVLLIVIGLCLLEALRHYWIIEVKQKYPNHKLALYTRLIIGIALNLFYSIQCEHISIELSLYELFAFIPIFNIGLNVLRGESVIYSSHASTASWYDKQLAKLSDIQITFFYTLAVLMFFITANLFYVDFSGFVQQIKGTYDWNKWIW